MNADNVFAAAVVLVSFNVIACAEPEPTDAENQESAVVTGGDRFVETRQPANYADTPAADRQAAVLDPRLTVAPISPAQKAGVAIDPPVAGDQANDDGAVDVNGLAPNVAGSQPITNAQKSGVTMTPPVARQNDGLDTKIVEECKGRYLCTGEGWLVLRREGSSCFLGDIVLEPNWTAQYREQPSATLKSGFAWSTHAEYIDVTFHDALTTHCERKD